MPVGSGVCVQRDRTDEDRNERRLRHIFVVGPDTDDAFLVSEILVLGGYADARSYPPDDLYDDVRRGAEREAREERAGLWEARATSSIAGGEAGRAIIQGRNLLFRGSAFLCRADPAATILKCAGI